ncbi:MAG: replication initiation protein [Flectobacillus sp.]|nr:replication initiation protein [Flectobacillus sp.]
MQGGKTGLVETTSKMDINEFRVFMTMLTMVLPDDEDFIEYEIRTQDIIKLYSLSDDGRYYEAIREATERLFNKKFVIYEKKEDGEIYRTTIHLIDETSEPVKESEQNRIRLKFNPKLKPYLLQLQKEYLTIDVRNIASIQNPNSVKLYLILRHQYNLGNRKVKYLLVRLREILAITDSEYPLYGNFKQKIIQKGIKDLEKYTDLVISKFEEEKVGRAVDKVIFHLGEKDVPVHLTGMTKKITRQVIKSSNGNIVISTSTPEYQLVEDVENVTGLDEVHIPQISSVESNPIEDLYLQAKEFKITKATLNKWIEELPMEQIQLGIEYVLQKIQSGSIKNIGGYLNTVVRNPSLLEEKKAKIEDETKVEKVVQDSQVAK